MWLRLSLPVQARDRPLRWSTCGLAASRARSRPDSFHQSNETRAGGRVVAQFGKNAIQARDYCVTKNVTLWQTPLAQGRLSTEAAPAWSTANIHCRQECQIDPRCLLWSCPP